MASNQKNARRIGLSLFLSMLLSVLAFMVLPAYASDLVKMNTLTGGTTADMSIHHTTGSTEFFAGEKFASGTNMTGIFFNKITIPLKRSGTGSPYTATLAIWNVSAGAPTASNYRTLIATFSANTLTTAYVDYNFTFAGHTIALNDAVGLFYEGDPLGGEAIQVKRVTSNLFDGSTTAYVAYNTDTGYTVTGTSEFRIRLVDTGDPDVPLCPDNYVCFDADGDGIYDESWPDPDGDRIVDWDWHNIPYGAADPADSVPGFFQVFGLSEDAADLVASIVTHAVVVFGIAGVWYVKTRQNPPFFVWAMLMIFAGGLGAAIGFMPLLYFFIEIALVVGGVAAMVKMGLIG